MVTNDRLIETTILVDLLRGKEEAITWVNGVSLQARWVLVITYFELLAGCRNRREQRTVAREMRQYRLLHLTEETSHTALAWFERFHLVTVWECWIASSVPQHSRTISSLPH